MQAISRFLQNAYDAGAYIGTHIGMTKDNVKRSVQQAVVPVFKEVGHAVCTARDYWLGKEVQAVSHSNSNFVGVNAGSSAVREVPASFEDTCKAIFEKYDCGGFDIGDAWHVFHMRNSGAAHRSFSRMFFSPEGYEAARLQWKVFLNPKKEYFSVVLDRVLRMCKEQNIQITGKIIQSDTYKRNGSSICALDDACEPKMLFSIHQTTSLASKQKLKLFIELVEKEFSSAEARTFGCAQGVREQWVAKEGEPLQWEKKKVPQWGNSFTKMRNSLLFYSQGGYSESGRNHFVGFRYDHVGLTERFEGENFYLYKGEVDPFEDENLILQLPEKRVLQLPETTTLMQQAKERIIRWTQEKQQQARTATGSLICVQQQRRYESSTQRHRTLAKAFLKKEDITDAEVARFASMSLPSYRAMKIQEAYQELGSFDAERIATKLGLTAGELSCWLSDAELEVWLNTQLMQLGADVDLDGLSLPQDQRALRVQIADLSVFLTACENNVSCFVKPFQVLKLYNLKKNLELLQGVSEVDVGALKSKCDQLLEKTIDQLSMVRKAALIGLLQAPSTPFELRQKIYARLFSVVKSVDGERVAINSPGKTTHTQIMEIKNQAKEVRDSIKKAICQRTEYAAFKAKLPVSICEFLDSVTTGERDFSAALELIIKKLDNVIERQEKRLRDLFLGLDVRLPRYFHATQEIETLGAIIATGIRPSQGSSYYGAFVSTFPGMLRYGKIVVGLTEELAFDSKLGKGRSVAGSEVPLFIPDIADVSRSVLHDQKREKWIGFEGEVYSNRQAKEEKRRFLAAFSFALKALYDQCQSVAHPGVSLEEYQQVEAQALAKLEASHLTFVRGNNRMWKAQVKETTSFWSQKYVDVDAAQLTALFKSLEANSLTAYLQTQILALLAQMKCYWHLAYSNRASSFRTDGAIEFEGGGQLPRTPYLIALDDETSLREYFADATKWVTRAGRATAYTVLQVKEFYKRMQANNADSEEVTDYLSTHVIPMMEQLIEFDFMSQNGVQVLKEWTE